MVVGQLLPIVVVGFAVYCLYDLVRAREARALPKWAWALIIFVLSPIGGIAYLVFGRQVVEQQEPSTDAAGWPVAADDGAANLHRTLQIPQSGSNGVGSIEVDHLTKRFGSVKAIDDLTFSVQPGHVTGFLGPNGAGKTTTLRVLLGLEAPSAGSTSVGGRRYRDIVCPAREVGALLDANAAHPGRCAHDHVLSVAQSNGIASRRVDEVLELTGLDTVAHRRVRGFSLGMKQRLGIATALLGEPQILLFDEPVNGLDAEGIQWIRKFFKSMATEGRTIFVSSHLMSEMALAADHLIIIGRGRLLANTTTEDFVNANARRDVYVRTPRADALARSLVDAGAGVTSEGDDTLSVTGLESDAIAELAAADRIPVYELTPRHASLEDAYLDLTRGDVEYGTGETSDQRTTQ